MENIRGTYRNFLERNLKEKRERNREFSGKKKVRKSVRFEIFDCNNLSNTQELRINKFEQFHNFIQQKEVINRFHSPSPQREVVSKTFPYQEPNRNENKENIKLNENVLIVEDGGRKISISSKTSEQDDFEDKLSQKNQISDHDKAETPQEKEKDIPIIPTTLDQGLTEKSLSEHLSKQSSHHSLQEEEKSIKNSSSKHSVSKSLPQEIQEPIEPSPKSLSNKSFKENPVSSIPQTPHSSKSLKSSNSIKSSKSAKPISQKAESFVEEKKEGGLETPELVDSSRGNANRIIEMTDYKNLLTEDSSTSRTQEEQPTFHQQPIPLSLQLDPQKIYDYPALSETTPDQKPKQYSPVFEQIPESSFHKETENPFLDTIQEQSFTNQPPSPHLSSHQNQTHSVYSQNSDNKSSIPQSLHEDALEKEKEEESEKQSNQEENEEQKQALLQEQEQQKMKELEHKRALFIQKLQNIEKNMLLKNTLTILNANRIIKALKFKNNKKAKKNTKKRLLKKTWKTLKKHRKKTQKKRIREEKAIRFRFEYNSIKLKLIFTKLKRICHAHRNWVEKVQRAFNLNKLLFYFTNLALYKTYRQVRRIHNTRITQSAFFLLQCNMHSARNSLKKAVFHYYYASIYHAFLILKAHSELSRIQKRKKQKARDFYHSNLCGRVFCLWRNIVSVVKMNEKDKFLCLKNRDVKYIDLQITNVCQIIKKPATIDSKQEKMQKGDLDQNDLQLFTKKSLFIQFKNDHNP